MPAVKKSRPAAPTGGPKTGQASPRKKRAGEGPRSRAGKKAPRQAGKPPKGAPSATARTRQKGQSPPPPAPARVRPVRPGPVQAVPAGRRQAPPGRKRKRRRHGRLTLNYVLFGILGAVVFAILCYTVFFRVYKIVALGDLERYTQQEIIEASGLKLKQSLFDVDQKEINVKVMSTLPYVESVQVHTRFPTTVELTVKVAQPAGVLQSETGYLYVNADGRILESAMETYDRSVPLITGMTPSNTQTGQYALNQSTDQMQMLHEIVSAIESSGLENVTQISLSDRLNLRVLIGDRVLVELGTDKSLDYKMRFVKTTMEDKLSRDRTGVFDVSMLEQVNRGFFRDERDLSLLMEQQDETARDEAGNVPGETIKVDPSTGAIIVGPHKQEESAEGGSSSGSGSSGASGASSPPPSSASSSSAAPQTSSSSHSEPPSSSEPSSSASASSETEVSSSSRSTASGIVVGKPAPKKTESSSSESSSDADSSQ